MADPVSNAVDGAKQSFMKRAKQVSSLAKTLTKYGVIGGGLFVVGPAFAMQPELIAEVANNSATIEAATTLTGAIATTLGNVAAAWGTGLANSGPIWNAYGSAALDGWNGISSWWNAVDFTPTT